MKKVLPLLAGLLCAASASAQISAVSEIDETKNYTLRAVDTSRGALYYNSSDPTNLWATAKTGGSETSYDPTSDNQKWQFTSTGTEGQYYIKNVGSGTYLTSTAAPWTLGEEASKAAFTIEAGTSGGFVIKSSANNLINISTYYSYGTNVTWNNQDNGNNFIITNVSDVVTVTYTVTFNGTNVGTATETQPIGNAPSVPSSLAKDFVNYTYNVETLTASTTEVTAEGTWAGPFEISTDYASAKWYNIYLKNASYYLTYADGSDPNVTITTLANRGLNAEQQWAFTGDPYTGFKLINNAAGSTLFAASADPTGDGNDGGNTHLYLTNDDTTYPEDLWTAQSSTSATNGFYLLNENGQGLNQRNASSVDYWNSGKDGGSTFVVSAAPTYTSLVNSEIKPYYDATGTGYFYLTEAGKTALDAAGYEAALTSCDQTTYESLKTIVAANVQYPATGYYRIKSSGKSANGTVGYIGLGSNYYGRGTAATGYGLKTIVTNPDQDASTVILLTEKDATAHTYTIYTQNEWATGATATNQPILMTATESEAGEFTIGAVTGYPGWCDIKQPTAVSGGYQYFHEAGWGDDQSCVCVWESGATSNPSRWQIEAVADGDQVMTPTLHEASGNYYATLNLAYGATVEGATAYYGKLSDTGDYLEMTALSEIPANTPVVLVGSAETATVNLKSTASAEVTGNALTGNYFPITWTSTNLSLGSVDEAPGFYIWSDGTTLEANKAYYVPADASVRGLSLSFGDETTSINTAVTPDATNGKVYDLQGRRVLNAQKGLYIVGGKKVLVK